MTTVTRKDLERQVMALQALAMECAKAKTVSVLVTYDGRNDAVSVDAAEWQCEHDPLVTGLIPLRWWCGSPILLPDALDQLKKAHRDILSMHMQALDTLDSDHTEVGA